MGWSKIIRGTVQWAGTFCHPYRNFKGRWSSFRILGKAINNRISSSTLDTLKWIQKCVKGKTSKVLWKSKLQFTKPQVLVGTLKLTLFSGNQPSFEQGCPHSSLPFCEQWNARSTRLDFNQRCCHQPLKLRSTGRWDEESESFAEEADGHTRRLT